jgi:ornithine carbamoyltransferase
MKRDFLSILDFSRQDIEEIFSMTDFLKARSDYKPLEGKSAALIFQKPSLRTRVSFEVAVRQFGGHPIFLSHEAIGIGQRERAGDVARFLSRTTNLIIARVFGHETLTELAKFSTVPVVNALSDLSHPCQVLADAYTMFQRGLLRPGVKVSFIGDGNNIVNSWLEFASRYPIHFVLAAPTGYHPDKGLLRMARDANVSAIEITDNPKAAAKNADVLYTDVWVSMGQEQEAAERRAAFIGFQINSELLALAKPDCIVMHCLPAHRDEEITDEVIESPHSVIFDQAENRLHVQKAIIAKLLGLHMDGNSAIATTAASNQHR